MPNMFKIGQNERIGTLTLYAELKDSKSEAITNRPTRLTGSAAKVVLQQADKPHFPIYH